MENLKKDVLKSFIPRAVLLPLSEKAKRALPTDKLIPIRKLPFNIGREGRLGGNERGLFIKLRLISDTSKPNNDIYLIDEDEFLQISKEHIEITILDDSYIIRDRGSMTGTTLNGVTIGGDRQIAQETLKDGDIIQIGSDKSEYKFQFLIFDV